MARRIVFMSFAFQENCVWGTLEQKIRTPSIRRSRDGISKIATFANWCIWGVTASIAVVFAGITLKDIPFVPAIASANPEYCNLFF